jgi:hypothetical protein
MQQQYLDKKILLYQNIALLLYLFIAILLGKITHLTKAYQKLTLTRQIYKYSKK